MFQVHLKREDPVLYPFLNVEGGLVWGFGFVLYLFVGKLLETHFSGFHVSYIYELAHMCIYGCVSMSVYTHIYIRKLQN